MKDKDYIEDLFSKAMNGHQVEVRPELWNGIQEKMTTAVVASTTSTVFAKSLLAKSIIGLSSLAVIGVSSYLYFNTKTEKPTLEQKEIKQAELKTPVKEEKLVEKEEQKRETFIVKEKTDEDVIIVPQFIAPQPIKEELQTTTIDNSGINEEAKVVVFIKEQQPISQPEKTLGTEKQAEPMYAEVVEPSKQGYVKMWNNTNVFTPNGDGINDYFFLETGKLKEFSISILDKDSKVVYVSEDPKFKWDGTNYLTGEKVPNGNYSYIIYAVDWSGEQIKQFNLLYITK